MADLTVLSKQTQGVISRNVVPVPTPIITLPAHVQEISNIKITIIADKRLIVKALNDIKSETNKDRSTSINKRKLILVNSIFYFDYLLRPEVVRKPPQTFAIQAQIEYCKKNVIFRRTATDYILLLKTQKFDKFTEYDVLIKYGAKTVLNIVSNNGISNNYEKRMSMNVLSNIITMIKKYNNEKAKHCIKSIENHIKAIKENQKDDGQISKRIEEASIDRYLFNM